MRTIAKVARKKLYYDRLIKELVYRAQLLAKAHGLKADGIPLEGEPQYPEIEWSDGLPIDEKEQIENETMALDAGITTKVASIMRVYKVDEDTAEEMAKEIKDENAIKLPTMNFGNMNKNMDGKGEGDKGEGGKGNMPPNMPPKNMPMQNKE